MEGIDKPNYWDKLMATKEGAASYMETYGEGPGCETRFIVSEFINPGESVLDVGCGPGWNCDHFRMHGPAISAYKGLDYSELFVIAANERNPGFYEVGDLRNVHEDDGSWDVVILQDCLEHTEGYEKPISEALRVSRKRVVISFWKASFQDGNNSEDQINIDGDDGFGATYNRDKFEKYLDTLDYHWMTTETSPKANRWHRFYIIDKEAHHGS